jgi:F-type H+-transporting ATPase subunit d
LSNPETAPKLDWAYYKARVPVAGMVDRFQKEYDGLKIAYPVDTISAQIDAQTEEVKKEISEFKKTSEQRIGAYAAQIAALEAMLPYDQMTMEDFADAHPELALDPLNKPTFWPHTPEEQLDYEGDKDLPDEHH